MIIKAIIYVIADTPFVNIQVQYIAKMTEVVMSSYKQFRHFSMKLLKKILFYFDHLINDVEMINLYDDDVITCLLYLSLSKLI